MNFILKKRAMKKLKEDGNIPNELQNSESELQQLKFYKIYYRN